MSCETLSPSAPPLRSAATAAMLAVALAFAPGCSTASIGSNADEVESASPSTAGAGAAGDGPQGAANPNGKSDGGECKAASDCKSGVCAGGTCAAPDGSKSDDGVKNGTETDTDCGGTTPNKCADGKACAAPSDCASDVCKAGTCVAPGPDDGIRNQDETDIDCGGTTAPKCALDKACNVHSDCASDACAYTKTCVAFKGCTAHAGGDTCGAGDTGDPGATHESCCARVSVTDRPANKGGPFVMDKYQLTAGRMRAFIERYKGDIQSWAATNPPGWNASYNGDLPNSLVSAEDALGRGDQRGCNVGASSKGGSTYWKPDRNGEHSDFTQEVLDEKALNCVEWQLAQAVCTWEGGRLADSTQIAWAYQNGQDSVKKPGQLPWDPPKYVLGSYPWQFADKSPYDADKADERLVHKYSYQTPNPPANMRLDGTDPLDRAFWVAPPGRRPKGANKDGIQDLAGNTMPWVNDGIQNFVWTSSWENHKFNSGPLPDKFTPENGYYAIGVRCVYAP